jgi:hypothetical protein
MTKHLITLLIFANLVGMATAQNALFIDFRNSYDQVLKSMEARSYVSIESAAPGEELVVEAQGATYIYRFNQGWLYEIEMGRQFDKRRIAKQAFKGCLDYFEQIEAEHIAAVEDDKLRKEQVYVRTGRVYRLRYKILADGSLDVSLRSRFTANTPLTNWEPYDYEAGYDVVQTLNQ